MTREQGRAKPKRCWNCRSRKTACDRALPSCQNCVVRGQQCLGYGVKLSWPRSDDGRRAVRGHRHRILPIRMKKAEFVNATNRDIQLWKDPSVPRDFHQDRPLNSSLTISLPPGLSTISLSQIDPFIATNEYSAVSRIISSACDDTADLYKLLVRMSLSEETPPAMATRHAFAALSYQHLAEQETAFAHQTKALSALQTSIETLSPTEPAQAFHAMAASMLLNIFETLNFDGSSMSWAIFFCGTKKIANLLHRPHSTYEGDSALILDWIFYHDTLYKFSIRHWVRKQDQQIQLAAQEKIISKGVFSPAVHDRDNPRHLSPGHFQTVRDLELRLDSIKQMPRVTTGDAAATQPEQQLAELYRLAAYIYLLRMGLAMPATSPKVATLITSAFELLKQAGICERPLPLFIIALEARTDDERRLVIEVLGASVEHRPLGNMPLVRRMVLAAWVQQDLYAGEEGGQVDPLVVYNSVISGNRVPPSFT
ncbi:fungal-specific transcription factor domain-containing protein [Apodospora peruviana]|uniref:Fungal-specific transcription factor domain-containing protein n=1 Tax=Apodospora peruviana TaxID=516989 RepID=A0AAE0HZE1_9PEZI|nr:fungal-specific transcription factor domain-containing protein [Apodospora peruviana]